ncbi:Trm112 family protein [Fervidibacter sacchari]|jgi:Uncharacterized conserved protein
MSEQQEIIPQWLLEIMCCPVPECRGDLELRADILRLVCKKCGRRYPIRDGIPVMLVEEAELPAEGQEKGEQ